MVEPSFSVQDSEYMAEAIRLAWQGLYTTDPNPRVGCVLVLNGEVVGRGYHVRAGEGHAEVNALAQAGEKARGATAYVTLEPCSHYGRTPPCAEALVKAGVSQVIVGMKDPNPQVAGNGLKILQDAGIQVKLGLMEAQARALNPGFIKRMETGMPWIRIKTAISVDGRTAMASGESQWITGPEARADVQRLRARSSAMLSGIGTIVCDDASLTVRESELGLDAPIAKLAAEKQPMRVVLDRAANLKKGAKVLADNAQVIWCVDERLEESTLALLGDHPNLEKFGLDVNLSSKAQLTNVMAFLAKKGCNEVMVEAGAELVGALIDADLYDELIVYMAPKLMGSSARPLGVLPVDQMKQAKNLQLSDVRQIGQDVRFTYRPSA